MNDGDILLTSLKLAAVPLLVCLALIDTPGPVPVEDIAMDRGVLCLEAKLTG